MVELKFVGAACDTMTSHGSATLDVAMSTGPWLMRCLLEKCNHVCYYGLATSIKYEREQNVELG